MEFLLLFLSAFFIFWFIVLEVKCSALKLDNTILKGRVAELEATVSRDVIQEMLSNIGTLWMAVNELDEMQHWDDDEDSGNSLDRAI